MKLCANFLNLAAFFGVALLATQPARAAFTACAPAVQGLLRRLKSRSQGVEIMWSGNMMRTNPVHHYGFHANFTAGILTNRRTGFHSLKQKGRLYFSDRDFFSRTRYDDVTLQIGGTRKKLNVKLILNSWGDGVRILGSLRCEKHMTQDMLMIQGVVRDPELQRVSAYTLTLKGVQSTPVL